jgi:microtubule-associated protein-like 6
MPQSQAAQLDSPFNFQVIENEQGDEFMAVKPWKGAIKQPSNFSKPSGLDKRPKVSMTLEHCHGYRARDKRNNVFYVNDDDLCYYAAAVGIVHTVRSNTQTFFNEHRDDILSMALHPDKRTVATGELGRRPFINIWSTTTLQRLHRISSGVEKNVDNLEYSPSGKYLMASCMDDDHKMFIFDAENGYSLVASEKGGRDFILGVVWTTDNIYVTVGLKHFKQWNLNGSSLKGSKGSFKSDNMITCVAKTPNNNLVCGSVKGELQVWIGTSNTQVKDAHQRMLDAIAIGSKW